jgi:hypothetical protein
VVGQVRALLWKFGRASQKSLIEIEAEKTREIRNFRIQQIPNKIMCPMGSFVRELINKWKGSLFGGTLLQAVHETTVISAQMPIFG